MVNEKEFGSVFDYSSPFEYESDLKMNHLRNTYKSAFSYHSISIPEDNIENDFKESLPSVILRNVITFVLYIIAILLFPVSAFICLKKVHALERIVLLRLGRLQPVRGPGLAVVLPCIDKWTKVDLRPKNFTVSSSQALTADKGIVDAKSDIEYRVADVISYVMKLKQQESTLRDLCLICLGNIISEKDLEDLELKREIINCNFKNEINRSAINWGLEIISVNMHSINVLKDAEPIDAIGTLMTAMKAATGQSSEHSALMMPFLPQTSETDRKPPTEKVYITSCVSKTDTRHPDEDILPLIQALANDVVKKEEHRNLKAILLLEVTSEVIKKIGISFDEGNVSVYEDDNDTVSDVTITLHEDILRQFLNRSLSPLDAYMDGKVSVSGDWKLLKLLSSIFN